MEQELTIQQAAEITGLGVYTLRYYERIALLDPVSRSANGYRHYSTHDIAWIQFLNRLRTTGMPIRKMQKFAELRRQGPDTIEARRLLLEAHQAEVQARLLHLQKNLHSIDEKIDHYKKLEKRYERGQVD